MCKKSVILGLVLVLAGAALFGWVFGEQKKQKQLQQQQHERLKANLSKLNELVGKEMDVRRFGDIVYEQNRQQEPDRYKEQEETRELVVTASGVFMLTGGTILSWWLLLGTARVLIKGFSGLTKLSTDFLRTRKEPEDEQLTQDDAKQNRNSEQEQKQLGSQSRFRFFQRAARRTHSQPEKYSKVLINSGWQNFNKDSANRQKVSPSQSLEDSLKARTENLEKQIAGFRQTAQSVRQTALQQSRPVEDSLRELTQQVSAIREYATHQQERVKKLQDGYDWNIIKNFCLRVIRCIDNLDSRINKRRQENIDAKELEQVRDELVFALESTGVEQFEPEISSDYRGQEKNTEAVKDKEGSDGPDLTGKIAKVIRPGYQYFIDEENVRVVRTAQVKLFGQVCWKKGGIENG